MTERHQAQLESKPATHTAWAPIFDEDGNFVKSVSVGEGVFKVDADGASSGRMWQYTRPNGYDSGYICLVPNGQEPPPPPQDVIENARLEIEQRKLEWDTDHF